MNARGFAIGLLLVGLASGTARAGVLYATGFEDPPFAAGSQLVGQDGWIAPAGFSPAAAAISTAAPAGGLQGVRVLGADLATNPDLAQFGYDAIGSYRRPVNFDALAAGTPVVRVQADVRLDGPQTAQTPDRVTGDFVSANVSLVSPDGTLAELSLSADGHVYGYGPATSYLFGVPYALGGYQTLAVEANFLTEVVGFYLNGVLLGTESFAGLGYSPGLVSRGSMVMYANLPGTVPGVERGDYTAYYDDFSITASAVPEPASVSLLAAGGLGLLGFARRRRAAG